MVFVLTLIKRGHIFNNATSIPAELRTELFQLQHPLFLSLNPRLADKDIIERDIPLGGTHWSSVPNPHMTSWIQMAKAGRQLGCEEEEGGWVEGDKSISGDYIIHSSTSQHSNHRGESTLGRRRRRRRRRGGGGWGWTINCHHLCLQVVRRCMCVLGIYVNMIHTCRWRYTDHILTGFKFYLSDILQAQPGDV